MSIPQSRSAFSKQPAHHLFVDMGAPTSRTTLELVREALSNVTALACSIRGSARIPMLGLTAICDRPVCLLQLQPIKGKYSLVHAAIDRLLSLYDDASGDSRLPADDAVLRDELKRVFAQFDACKTGPGGRVDSSRWLDLQITFVSEQQDNHLIKQLKGALQKSDLENIKKIQLLKVEKMLLQSSVLLELGSSKSPSGVVQSPSLFSDSTDPNGTPASSVSSELIEIVAISRDTFAFENFFKSWLHDCTTDTIHLELCLPATDDTMTPVTILCDVHEPFLNPGAFIFSNHFFISVDPMVSHGLLTNQVRHGNGAELPVLMLEALHLVKLSGLCESTVYGVPLVLQPTCCWKLDWNDLETNSHRFQSLCRALRQADSVLIARARLANLAAQSHDDGPYSYFGLFAARGSMMIKPLVFRDILLPPYDSSAALLDEELLPPDVRLDIESRVVNLATYDTYNPVHFGSGLCANLKRCLTNAQATRGNVYSLSSCPPDGVSAAKSSMWWRDGATPKTNDVDFESAKSVFKPHKFNLKK